jgi:hypothetical protein
MLKTKIRKILETIRAYAGPILLCGLVLVVLFIYKIISPAPKVSTALEAINTGAHFWVPFSISFAIMFPARLWYIKIDDKRNLQRKAPH